MKSIKLKTFNPANIGAFKILISYSSSEKCTEFLKIFQKGINFKLKKKSKMPLENMILIQTQNLKVNSTAILNYTEEK